MSAGMSAGRLNLRSMLRVIRLLGGNLRLASRSQRAEGDSPRELTVIFIFIFLLKFCVLILVFLTDVSRTDYRSIVLLGRMKSHISWLLPLLCITVSPTGQVYERMRSLLGCCLWGRTESDTTETTQQQQQQHERVNEIMYAEPSAQCLVQRSA